MVDKLNKPKKGVADWHIPVNQNFSDLEDLLYDSQTGEPFSDTATELIQDIVGGLITGQNDANVTYDDTNEQLSVDVSTVTNEEIEDTVSSLLASDSNLSWSYDDTNDTLTVSLSDSISVNTLEADDETINNSLTDPSGETHTGELADIDDTKSEQQIADTAVAYDYVLE